ncbi:MAG: ABC transporter ATP-binding protein [Propionibacteriaceae bacterium]|jgi:ABC-2 type transport system ATP-binding protein|nr:ABC transporter ATP-binding protein [Propionibacteriaceae bacterium]
MAVRPGESGLVRSFGAVRAVDGIALEIEAGAVFGLLGPDGAGKTTLIRMLATVLRPDSGDAEIFGISARRHPERLTGLLGYMPQQFSMYPDLTVLENIDFFAKLRGVPKPQRAERAEHLLGVLGLGEFTRRRAARLSGGMKQKLMLASVLMHEPKLLLLDEPTTGVDPVSRREFWQVIDRLRADGKTILVATPYMDEAERCTEIAFIDSGRITREGTPAEIKAQVPGTLLRVATVDSRKAMGAVNALVKTDSEHRVFLSAHLFGDEVRVLAADAPLAASRLESALNGAGIPHETGPIPMDMESAFAYLAVGR